MVFKASALPWSYIFISLYSSELLFSSKDSPEISLVTRLSKIEMIVKAAVVTL